MGKRAALPEGFIRCKNCKRSVRDQAEMKLRHLATFHRLHYGLCMVRANGNPHIPTEVKSRLWWIQLESLFA